MFCLRFSLGDTDAVGYVAVFVDSTGQIHTVTRTSSAIQWDVETDASVGVGEWNHFSVSQDGTAPVIYLNGVAVAKTFLTGDAGTKVKWINDVPVSNARIGNLSFNNNGENYFFAGALDDLRIYSASLSSSEVLRLYNIGR